MILRTVIFISALLVSSLSYAVVQQHTFYISGTGGETGTGTFTWDDTNPTDGIGLRVDQMLTVSISISGGNVIASPANFVKANCGGGFGNVTPDFSQNINFWCNNGTDTLAGIEDFINELNDGSSTLTFSNTPAAATPVPTMSVWGLGILAGLLGLMGFVRRRKA